MHRAGACYVLDLPGQIPQGITTYPTALAEENTVDVIVAPISSPNYSLVSLSEILVAIRFPAGFCE